MYGLGFGFGAQGLGKMIPERVVTGSFKGRRRVICQAYGGLSLLSGLIRVPLKGFMTGYEL